MTIKSWMLRKVNGMGGRGARAGAPAAGGAGSGAREPSLHAFGRMRGADSERTVDHLGPYGPLIAAIREELEHFVTRELRLHLAIAERDRYVLASIEVECEGSDEERELLRRFVREFKPEQIKHYLAKEVIAGLRNASAMDLSQFAGLNAAQEDEGASDEEEEAYGALIAELRGGAPGVVRPYRVSLVGRWSQEDAPALGTARARGPQTPLAARAFAAEIDDALGAHRIELASVVPGRRYAVGKGEGCDIVVDGVYASRRHCEIWLDRGVWWAADTGSTNGIRVEQPNGAVLRDPSSAHAAGRRAALELAPGARLVLSAHTQGPPAQYPRLVLRPVEHVAVEAAAAGDALVGPATPVTPIAPARRREGALTITARMNSGVRSVEVAPGVLPFRVGRSRNQALVIDWAHAEVSGRHLEIVAVDEEGAVVVVHGDNGVTLEGTAHAPGAQFRWKTGATLVLGHDDGHAPSCTLTLSRNASG